MCSFVNSSIFWIDFFFFNLLGFDPKFECSSVRETKKNFRNSPGQKSILQFFNSKLAASSPAVNDSGRFSEKEFSNTI